MTDASKEGEPQAGPLVKIGDFARLAGTNLRTLRYYEELGLLVPAARSSGGFRFYRTEDLDRLRMVARLQRLGLELSKIRELMDARSGGGPRTEFLARVGKALRAQSVLIEARIGELQEQRHGIEESLTKLAECQSCSHTPEPGNNFCHPCQVDGRTLPLDLSALF